MKFIQHTLHTNHTKNEERMFKNLVFTLYAIYVDTMPRLVHIETCFFGIIHCS